MIMAWLFLFSGYAAVTTKYILKICKINQPLTAISRHADIDIPLPSINFKAYSLPLYVQFIDKITKRLLIMKQYAMMLGIRVTCIGINLY